MLVRPTFARHRAVLATVSSLIIGLVVIAPVLARLEPADAGVNGEVAAGSLDHLVISEVLTGAASASDEFVELYNPTPGELALDGTELIYASASGVTVTRKVVWDTGSATIPSGAHLLLANEAGAYAALADATYSGGLAAAGGGVALRTTSDGASVDAVGWGTATAWLEGAPAAAAPAGSSIERLPGGAAGSGQDTNDNAADFVVNAAPDPQGSTSTPIASATPGTSSTPAPSATVTQSPTLSATPTPTAPPTPTATPTPAPTPTTLSIADARALPDGSEARIAGVAISDSEFADGGGCLTDGSAGMAVLLDAGAFARGDLVVATGTIDDRYAQRTMRVGAGGLEITGAGSEPAPSIVATGEVGEAVECRLVRISGAITSAPTQLSSGPALDVDDGSGTVRVLVATATGIDTGDWARGSTVTLIGVVGQRDSSGTGGTGYRVQPRDPADIVSVTAPGTPVPSASASASVSPDPGESPPADLLTIAEARAAATGATVRVRGVVTLQDGLVDAPTAVIQDASGAIVLRLGDAAGSVTRGSLIEVVGKRSTKSGMETIHTDLPPLVLGAQPQPAAMAASTGGLGEGSEARLVVVRGTVTSAVTRSTAGNVAFTIDDGSGPLRVTLFASAGFANDVVLRDDVVEATGVLAQETTGALPDRGYRLWPRGPADLQVFRVAPTPPEADGGGASPAAGHESTGLPPGGAPSPARGSTTASGPPPRIALPVPSADPVTRTAADATGARMADLALTAARTDPARSGVALLAAALALCLVLAAAAVRAGTLGRLRAFATAVLASTAAPGDDGT